VVLFRFSYGSRFSRTIWRRAFTINDVQDAPMKPERITANIAKLPELFEPKDLTIARQV
jgi:hypothetical protein